MGAIHFRALSLPLWALVAALCLLGATGAVLQGDRARRLGVFALVTACLPWAVTMALSACTDDAALALRLHRAGIGPVTLAGPALLYLVLSDAGKLDAHRPLIGVATLFGAASMVATWSTDLVVASVRRAGGMLYPEAAPFNAVHVGMIAVWAGIGIVLARRGQRHNRDQTRRMVMRTSITIAALSIIGMVDVLVSFGVVDIFPVSWLPAFIGALLGISVLVRTNRLRADGVDRRGAVELAATVVAGAAVIAIVALAHGTGVDRPLALAAITAPLPAVAFLIGQPRRDGRGRRHASVAGDEVLGFAERIQVAATDADIATALTALLRDELGARQVRLWRAAADGLAAVGDAPPPPPLDARVRAWLIANRAPLIAGDVPSMRLGGLRALVEALVAAADADVLAPLVDRDALVGLVAVTMPDGRAPRPGERNLIADAAQAVAQALTFTGLKREAEARAQTAREVEVADAIQQARADGDVRLELGRWNVLACYRPGAKVAGDVWTWAELRGGDLLVVVGDVIGRGVSAALIAAAVVGAVESAAALQGDALDPAGLLELLHETVVGVSGPTATLGAFAARLGHGRVRFAAAGHRGAYLVQPRDAGDAEVRALAAAGTPLGDRRLHLGRGEAALGAKDLLVIASDGVIDVADARGARWSERRLLRALRTWVPRVGQGAAEQLVSAAAAHAGDAPLGDDLVVVVAQPRARASDAG